ncbi:WXG100 family type VII secretion target [Rhodococcoides corynebacterioides]|uniref:WXG100 family type VII secretion target n=1 Tax=Rhodococcoides corynebacterioides TaxID=53972 RepID=UPI00082C62A8|nr:WXG100 family type VII secretion target [Rhodococcus corynebacterioides]MBY6351922.1 WXG100 family type VII secretion target [Rhodococcus corynebacterioides]MBY6363161.1 WXG100 family type VII secretion target [Rhodococcus corynebacterioides]
MERIDVEVEGVRATSRAIASAADLLGSELADVAAIVRSGTAGWHGAAAAAFAAGWDRVDAGGRRVVAALGEQARALETAAAGYAHEDTVAATRLALT